MSPLLPEALELRGDCLIDELLESGGRVGTVAGLGVGAGEMEGAGWEDPGNGETGV